jgi:hypothetical protein
MVLGLGHREAKESVPVSQLFRRGPLFHRPLSPPRQPPWQPAPSLRNTATSRSFSSGGIALRTSRTRRVPSLSSDGSFSVVTRTRTRPSARRRRDQGSGTQSAGTPLMKQKVCINPRRRCLWIRVDGHIEDTAPLLHWTTRPCCSHSLSLGEVRPISFHGCHPPARL